MNRSLVHFLASQFGGGYPRIRSMAARHAFREIPSADEVNIRCSTAYARWRKLRKAFQPSLRPLDMPAA